MAENSLGNLYIAATPIGNLQDITLRVLENLEKVDWILAEDTRVASKLLKRYNLPKKLKSFHEHSDSQVFDWIAGELVRGKNFILLSDAGTPGICDPGGKLVAFIREKLPLVKIIPLPGVSAATTALSVAGIYANQFTFLGYPPHKKGRKSFFEKIKSIGIYPVVFYESCHRFLKALKNLEENFGTEKKIFIGREMTKIYEDFYSGSVGGAKEYFKGEKLKGEFVIILTEN